ncbi:DUF1214 domain-containing protein [Bradyrhizobium sp. 613_E4_N2_2]|uniref:DUF1214 domain-containing protein n=1 Tax=Bradyrhizobium sp. 613_E4_N2_2 TaxID=3240371 RepID=UPI003F8B70EF
MLTKRDFLRSVSLAAITTVVTMPKCAHAQNAQVKLDHAQVENIVRRSYQYVAMYNVNNKAAMDARNPLSTDGWNKFHKSTELANANMHAIARPNNDTLYQIAMLDLRNEPVILDVPAFDTRYASMETSAYDGYIDIPLSTRSGDYKEPTKLLFYSARTQGYTPDTKVAGVGKSLAMTGDFVIAFIRVMPESSNPAKHARILEQIKDLKVQTLSEYQGKSATASSKVQFPAYGATDQDTYGTNLLEVMQFVFNHTTFDSRNELDQALLDAYRPLGVEPGKTYDAAKVTPIDGATFRQVSEEVKQANIAILGDQRKAEEFLFRAFKPKGHMDLATLVFQNVIGPIGQPADEALYLPVNPADNKPMNALHDYVIKMTKDELPPALAFWSVTLYDTKNGWFIPNKENKYSVGQNAGYKLNADGGIEIHIAANKPDGVPPENWLPINREDQGISPMLRLYQPDLAKATTWKPPKAQLVS